tara:strand:- start:9233 stop:9733 length:501 start_codon:yes stop_codon:yes gene_type:complete
MTKFACFFCALTLSFLGSFSTALPEDLNQDMLTSCPARSESFLDQGLEICRGTENEPAVMSQGSLKLSGLEITIEREAGLIQKVTASGSPASFQQQPEINQAVVFANGANIIFDNVAQLIIIEGAATFSQEGTINTSAEHIEYDIANRKLDATQMNMVIPASTQSP